MASQVGIPFEGGPAHSGAETALSGAVALSQDEGLVVESPLTRGSQASVVLAGEYSLPRATGSTAHSAAAMSADDSALSMLESKDGGSTRSLITAGRHRLRQQLAYLSCVWTAGGTSGAKVRARSSPVRSMLHEAPRVAARCESTALEIQQVF